MPNPTFIDHANEIFSDQQTQVAWNLQEHIKKTSVEEEKKLISSIATDVIRYKHLLEHQIDSMNDVLTRVLPLIAVQTTGLTPIVVYDSRCIHRCKIIDMTYIPPFDTVAESSEQHQSFSAAQARAGNSNYDVTYMLTVLYEQFQRDVPKEKAESMVTGKTMYKPPPSTWGPRIHEETFTLDHFRFPLMLGCVFDHAAIGRPLALHHEPHFECGGYFTCGGISKVFAPTVTQNRNRWFISDKSNVAMKTKKTTHHGTETTYAIDGKGKGTLTDEEPSTEGRASRKIVINGEVRCLALPDRAFHSTSNSCIFLNQLTANTQTGEWQLTYYIQNVKNEIPVTVMIVALGWSVIDFLNAVYLFAGMNWCRSLWNILQSVYQKHPVNVKTQRDAFLFLARASKKDKLPEQAQILDSQKLLREQIMPHISLENTHYDNKALYLTYGVWLVLARYITLIPENHSRDNYAGRRLEMCTTFASLFRQRFRLYLIKPAEGTFQKEVNKYEANNTEEQGTHYNTQWNWQHIFQGARLNSLLQQAISTGNFGSGSDKTSQRARKNVTLLQNGTNENTYLSAGRRLSTTVGPKSKAVGPRLMDGSSLDYSCPNDTPESERCGLVKNAALSFTITMPAHSAATVAMIRAQTFHQVQITEWRQISDIWTRRFPPPWLVETKEVIFPNAPSPYTLVSCDYVPLFFTNEPERCLTTIRQMRRSMQVSPYLGIHWTNSKVENAIWIENDQERFCSLLIVLTRWIDYLKAAEKGWNDKDPQWVTPNGEWRPKIWDRNHLWQQGVLEYIDACEQQSLSIAPGAEHLRRYNCEPYTHMKIQSSLILGICASETPFPHHNQGPRNVYQSAMIKQAISYILDDHRVNGTGFRLMYGQEPLVQTRFSRDIRRAVRGYGMNAKVALYSDPYNQEDAIVMHKAFIERGAYLTEMLHTYQSTQKKQSSGALQDIYERPDPKTCCNMKDTRYEHLEQESGKPKENTYINGGDAIIGKTVAQSRQTRTDSALLRKRDDSVFVKSGESGIVTKVFVAKNRQNQHRVHKVLVRSRRYPQIADKFSGRNGQKGTLGHIRPTEDMIWEVGPDGGVPDIIINPTAMPSRMTDGMNREGKAGVAASIMGEIFDGTAFVVYDDVKMGHYLLTFGNVSPTGKRRFMHPHTGEMLEQLTAVCEVYYQRLKHFADDKMHARTRGPSHPLTRQPVEGRARDGGLRLGEMERDVLISYGCSEIFRERARTCSDQTTIDVCKRCGLLSVQHEAYGFKYCFYCKRDTEIYSVVTSYVAKLLMDELKSVNILMRLILKTNEVKTNEPKPTTVTANKTMDNSLNKMMDNILDTLQLRMDQDKKQMELVPVSVPTPVPAGVKRKAATRAKTKKTKIEKSN